MSTAHAEENQSPSKPQPRTSQEKFNLFVEQFSIFDFIDPSKPWVLVENGSLVGFFDWVPSKFRVGPWSLVAKLYMAAIIYMLALGTSYVYIHTPSKGWMQEFNQLNEPYTAFTASWIYNLSVFVWMIYVAYSIMFSSPMAVAAWITYTVQSWTIITLRHGLSVFAPFFPSLTLVSEILRFPSLISASVTFFVWNFLLAPVILIFLVKDGEQRKRFLAYFTNFRLTQLHVFNIFFAVINGVYAKPIRPLHLGDLCIGGLLMVGYMFWYYFVLDRFGVHLYPIFSPRTPYVVFAWSLVIMAYAGGFLIWQAILEAKTR